MSTAMERYEQPLALIQSIDDLARLSKQVADSNYYQGTDSAAQASVKLMIARELGLGITSISNIHLVKGKISLGYQILIALVKRSGKYDLRFKERSETRVVIEWYEDGEVVGTSKFDMDDAKRAGLSGDNYRKFPIRMLTARAVSDGFNTFAPECAGGALYTEGEIPEDDPPKRAAPRRREAASPASEVVVDAVVLDEAPAPEKAAEDNPTPSDMSTSGESEQASSSTIPAQTEACKAMLRDLKKANEEQYQMIVESAQQLGLTYDAAMPFRLVKLFGDDATSVKPLVRALSVALDKLPPVGEAEGELPVEPPFPESPERAAADIEAAARFDEFANDTTAENIDGANAKRDEISERLAAAGQHGK